MGHLDVFGIVSSTTGRPIVQFQQYDEERKLVAEWQSEIEQAREMAQQIVEASMNAVYDAALVGWIKKMWPDEWEPVVAQMLTAVRTYRQDDWGLGRQPEFGLGHRHSEEGGST